MGKQSESTAINQLINLVATQGPSVKDPGNDLFSSPPKGSQPDLFGTSARPTARGTQHNMAAPPPPPVRVSTVIPSRQTTIPPVPPMSSPSIDVSSTMRGTAMPHVSRIPLPPPARRTIETPAVAPSPFIATPVAPTPAIAQLTGPHGRVDLTGQSFFAENRVEHTSRIHAPRAATNKDLLKRLALPAFAVIVLGGSIGGYLAMSSKDAPAQITTAPVKVEAKVGAAPIEAPAAPATAAAIAPAITTAPPTSETQPMPAHPTLVDIRLDSTPDKASVTLIDSGKSMIMGTTPISISVDPSRTYELVFSYPDRPTKIAKLDPKTTKRLAVVLDGGAHRAPAAKTEVAASVEKTVARQVETPAPAKVAAPAKKVAKVEKAAVVAEPDFEIPAALSKAEKPEKVVEKAAKTDAAEGVLMISSKPPCEIVVDGKPTGLMTPQRAMKLPVGKHKITLINQDKDLQMTVPVEISADKPLKVIQNLLANDE